MAEPDDDYFVFGSGDGVKDVVGQRYIWLHAIGPAIEAVKVWTPRQIEWSCDGCGQRGEVQESEDGRWLQHVIDAHDTVSPDCQTGRITSDLRENRTP